MIEKMTKYSWILLSSDNESFLEELRSLGVIDIRRSSKPVDESSAAMLQEIESLKTRVYELETGSDAELSVLLKRKIALENEFNGVAPWGEFDKGRLENLGVPISFHCVEKKKFNPLWEEEYALQVVSQDNGLVRFVVLGDSNPPVPAIAAPERSAAAVSGEIQDLDRQISEHKAFLEKEKASIPTLNERIDRLQSDLSLYLAGCCGQKEADERLIVYEGFAPSSSDAALGEAFEKMNVVCLKEEAAVEDNPPIKLRNNRFVRMFEVLTDMYGRPKYDGFDPTPYLSIFFLLFFSMCIGDAAYGIILILVGLLFKKKLGNIAPLVVTLGVGSTMVGLYFHTFFSIDITTWGWIPDSVKALMLPAKIAGYDGAMILSLVIGIIHLLLAMIVKTIYATRNKGFLESLGTWGWTIFWLGLTVIGAFALAGILDKEVTKWAIITLGAICAIGIFPLNNIHRNPLINVGSGLWDTYNMASGILGDVLSYLRLYALGLAGAMLGLSFNGLAAMVLGDGGVVGWIGFVLLVVFGHTLNLAMAVLGAFVHPLRLNFLEFFKNSDYDGSGVKYEPIK